MSQAHLRSVDLFSKIPSSSSRTTSPSALTAQESLWAVYLQHPSSITTLLSLLSQLKVRQFSSPFLLDIAKRAVSNPKTFSSLFKLIARVPPLNDSTPIIAPIVTALIKRNIDPVEIQRLALGALQADPEAAKLWPGYLWERIMAISDFETSVTMLDAYKALALPVRLASAVSLTPTGNGASQTQSVGPTRQDPVTGSKLSHAQVLSVSKPFTGVLRSWIRAKANDSSRINSAIPSEIAQEYLGIIGDRPIPISFLNSWMDAERLAGNIAAADSVWQMYDTSPVPFHPDGWPRSRPDSHAWICWMKLRKSLPSPLSYRESVRRIFSTLPDSDISSSLLNAVLSSMVTSSETGFCDDLPLLLLVLRSFDARGKNGPAPNGRTIDIVSAGIIRLWRSTGQYLDRMLVASLARQTREDTEQWSETYRMRWAIHPSEWKLISLTLSELLPRSSQYRPVRISRSKAESLVPFGERAFQETEDGFGQRVPTYKTTQEGDPVPVVPQQTRSLKPAELLEPMMALVERAIRFLLAERIETDEELQEAFERLMEKAWEDVLGDAQRIESGWRKGVEGDDGTDRGGLHMVVEDLKALRGGAAVPKASEGHEIRR